MKLLNKLERNFGQFAIPNLTMMLVASQALCFILASVKPEFVKDLALVPHLVLQGEFWRIATFMVVPPQVHPIIAFFALYIFYFMGTSLEEKWGIFRYNLYIFISFIATLIAAFLGPVWIADNIYIESSVFLAFAFLYPDFEFLLFFILPVKVKYLAWFTWFIYALQLLTGSPSEKTLIIASLCNFFLFFGSELRSRIKNEFRRKSFEAKQTTLANRHLHQCATCNITERVNRDMEFRVCSKCRNGEEYCVNHIHSHEHT